MLFTASPKQAVGIFLSSGSELYLPLKLGARAEEVHGTHPASKFHFIERAQAAWAIDS
jgi:hypothetical protein